MHTKPRHKKSLFIRQPVDLSAKCGTPAPGDCQEEPSRSSVELMRWVSNTSVAHPQLRYSLRSCSDLDLELHPRTAMYKSGPRHQIFLFLHPDHLKTRFKRFPFPRRPLSLLSRNLFQKSHPIPHQNPVLSPVAQRSPKLGNSNTGLSSANTASLEFQDIATLQGTSRTDDWSSGRVLSCDVQTHQCQFSSKHIFSFMATSTSLGRSSPFR